MRLFTAGVFFFYDLSSIRVTVEPHGMSFGHLITNFCAIAGGIITVREAAIVL